jgi:GNAT superfamily N-acetyltransferase
LNDPALPQGFAWDSQIQLGRPEVYNLSKAAWPRFLLEESDIPDPILKFQITARDFAERFRAYGIREIATGRLVAFIQAVHVAIDPAQAELSDLGWRFSIQDAAKASPKNCSSLVEASVDGNFRGLGLAKKLLEKAKGEARSSGFRVMIAPVRPSGKKRFPEESMEAYCARKTDDGRVYDPWLRAHLEAGAQLRNVCHESVCVKASLARWREWTGLPFDKNGAVLLPEGLVPLEVHLEEGLGIYREPNVWVSYEL